MEWARSQGNWSLSAFLLIAGRSDLAPQDAVATPGTHDESASAATGWSILKFEVDTSTLPIQEGLTTWDMQWIQSVDSFFEVQFNLLNERHDLAAGFMQGASNLWFPILALHASSASSVDYRPDVFVDYNLAVLIFDGRQPEHTDFAATAGDALLQWKALRHSIEESQGAIAVVSHASASDSFPDTREIGTLKSQLEGIRGAQLNLIRAIIQFDQRARCEEFLDFDFANQLRRAWQIDALESIARSSLEACQQLLQTMIEERQERSRRNLRFILAILTVLSGLTAVLTAIDFSTSDTPLDADSVARIALAVGIACCAVLVGLGLRRRSLL